MNISNMELKYISVTIILTIVPMVLCENTCGGEHEYNSSDGSCKQCETCPPGMQPREFCGYGERSKGYVCEACPENTYSNEASYHICTKCNPCTERWNSEVEKECSNIENRKCGKCFSGFFRPLKSDGTTDDECHSCEDALRSNEQCKEEDKWPWKMTSILAFAVCGTLLIIVIVLIFTLCCGKSCCNRARDQENNEKEKKQESESIAESTSMIGTGFTDNRSSDGLYTSRTGDGESAEPVRDIGICGATQPTFNPSVLSKPRIDMFSLQQEIQPKNGACFPPRFVPSHIEPSSNPFYSQMSTVPYDEPSNHTVPIDSSARSGSMTYSNMPTQPYDESVRTQSLESRASSQKKNPTHEPGSSRSRGSSFNRRRRQAQTSSSESLLDNVDRDSKVVGRQRSSPVDFEKVEFFDTNSINDERENSQSQNWTVNHKPQFH